MNEAWAKGERTADGRPLVTVAICTHNRANLLPRAVASVLGQTYDHLELIVVDDGSTDATGEVLAGYDDPRLRVVTNDPNKGLPASRNVVLDHARGEYVTFLDDDDEFLPTKVEKQVALLERSPGSVGAAWCFQSWNDSTSVTSRRILLRGNVFDRVKLTDIMMMQPLMMRRSVFDVTGRFDPELNYYEDFDFTFRLARHFDIDTVEEELVMMHSQPNSMSRVSTERIRTAHHVLEKYPELHGDRKVRSRWLLRIADSHATNGDRAAWRATTLAAWRADPTSVRPPVALALGLVGGEGAPRRVKRRIMRIRRRLRNRRT